MPFIARKNGRSVIPEEIEDGVDVWCKYCKGRMRPRDPKTRARHFFHIENIGQGEGGSGSCEGGGEGESETHRKYKSFAVSRLKKLYPEYIDHCKPEQRLSTVLGDEFTELPSDNEDRQADAMMVLEEPTKIFGRGLIIEIQYRNLGKDIESTTKDYLHSGFSVLWVDEEDFDSNRCLLTKREIRDRVVSVWPNAVPVREEWAKEFPSDQQSKGEIYIQELRNMQLETIRTNRGVFQRSPAEVPARLPREFIDSIAEDIKLKQDWSSLFTPPKSFADIWCYSKVPATLPREWHQEAARRYWNETPWHKRFWLAKESPKFEKEYPDITEGVPLNKWLIEESEGGHYRGILKAHHKYGSQLTKSTSFSKSSPEEIKCEADYIRDWCHGPEAETVMDRCADCTLKAKSKE